MTYFEEQLKKFRNGEEFSGYIDDHVLRTELKEEDLKILATALRRETLPVREQVARLLVEFGLQSDPLYEKGGGVIRERSILSLLIVHGLSLQDVVRDYIIESIRAYVPTPFIKEYGGQLVENLERWPDPTLLLVVAKGKLLKARPVIDKLSVSPEWTKLEKTAIARAALGDTEIENKYIERFVSTNEPKEKARLAETLGYIGTEPALRALAGEVRTDLIIEIPYQTKESVRLDIIEALRYNFPEKIFLYRNSIYEDEGYARVEKFCEETFGTVWKTERPPFLTIQSYPDKPPK